MIKEKCSKKMPVKCGAEITSLKAKLKKAEAKIKTLEKEFVHGYEEAMKDIQKAEAAFEKYMDKAATEFEKKILPKIKKVVSKPTKKKTK